jgi:prepilin signal peptidase PulO-like enzyme (type II secretory pathway)
MYYDLLARFSAAVEFFSPRLLRVEVVIAAVVLLIIGLGFSWLLADVAVFALFVLLVLWMADRWTRRKERDGAGLA